MLLDPASRRDALALLALGLPGLAAMIGVAPAWAQNVSLELGPPEPFDHDWLRNEARRLAGSDYVAPILREPQTLDAIDYDAFQQIRFRAPAALWYGDTGPWPVQPFHAGRFFREPVDLYVVEDGQARQLIYDQRLFDFGPRAEFARSLPADLGFAGFRVMGRDGKPDWLAFLGASYFRSSGQLDQYGASARGIAIDTALPTPEEFPRFTRFWLERSARSRDALVIWALLDGPSVTGAYRIEAERSGPVVMDFEVDLFFRKDVRRLGIAPLTSMFWYSETNHQQSTDWRPEIHDSDGLSIWTGAGERLWRPLNNPRRLAVSYFVDRSPKGFGLMQRDRAFSHYEDDGVFYERRPSLWVEPLGDWGPGAVQLVEIPTDDEIHDNIVAYWVPDEPATAGSSRSLAYRLHWRADEPYAPDVGRVVATRIGRGGAPGVPRPPGIKKFVVDFEGPLLEPVQKGDPVEPVISVARGTVTHAYCLQVVGTKRWRGVFDLDVDGDEPVDLRMYLRLAGTALTETWLYQYHPFTFAG